MAYFHEIIKVPEGALAWIYLFSENGITEVPRHWHDSLELTLLVSGTAQYTINGSRLQVQEGDLLLINSGDMHSCKIPPQNCEAINIMFPSHFLTRFGYDGDLVLFRLNAAHENHEELVRCCQRLYHVFAMRDKDPYSQFRVNSMVCDIAYLLLSCFRWEDFAPRLLGSEKHRRRCREILRYIDEHYTEDLHLEDLVRAFGISREHLARIFRDYMGTTYKKHLTKVRMYHAYKRLTSSDLSIIEIALECGFSDSRAFISSFSKVYGTTPGQYRRKYYQNVQDNFKNAAKMEFFYSEDEMNSRKKERIIQYNQ